MSYAQTGPVVVQLAAGNATNYPWATRVKVDRTGNLHVYGHHRQHAVHLEGEWQKYGVSAPTAAEILSD